MGKARVRKRTGAGQGRRRLPWRGRPRFAWLLVALVIVGVTVVVRSQAADQAMPQNPGQLRAAIVDQLYNLQPNQAFIAEVTGELEDYGFEVDLHQGDDVTVDLFRRLPGYGYKLIVFRTHSGMLALDGEEIERTLLFTNEPYTEFKHGLDQLGDRLAMARVGEGHPLVFGIPAEFISKGMQGRFDDTVIIMMGCSGMYYMDLATAFVAKGASVYLAWSASVKLDYVDRATSYLVTQLCSEELTIEEAVSHTMDVIGPDYYYRAVLMYGPPQVAEKTLEELWSG